MTTSEYKNERTIKRGRTSIGFMEKLQFDESPIKAKQQSGSSSESINWPPRFPSKCSTTSRASMEVQGGRMKLRDYLFLTKTAAKKKAELRKNNQKENMECGNTEEKQLNRNPSKDDFKKRKYNLENGQMFKILLEEMDMQLSVQVGHLRQLHSTITGKMFDHETPTQGEMSMMYGLRSMLKDKLKNVIGEMRQLVSRQISSSGYLPYFNQGLDAVLEEDHNLDNIPSLDKQFSFGTSQLTNKLSFGLQQ